MSDYRELESDLEAAVHSQSKSTSPIPVGSPDNMSHSYSASPKSIPSESMAMEGDNDMGTRWEWQGEGSGEECNKCEWAGVKYSVGDVVYVKPRQVKPLVVLRYSYTLDFFSFFLSFLPVTLVSRRSLTLYL